MRVDLSSTSSVELGVGLIRVAKTPCRIFTLDVVSKVYLKITNKIKEIANGAKAANMARNFGRGEPFKPYT